MAEKQFIEICRKLVVSDRYNPEVYATKDAATIIPRLNVVESLIPTYNEYYTQALDCHGTTPSSFNKIPAIFIERNSDGELVRLFLDYYTNFNLRDGATHSIVYPDGTMHTYNVSDWFEAVRIPYPDSQRLTQEHLDFWNDYYEDDFYIDTNIVIFEINASFTTANVYYQQFKDGEITPEELVARSSSVIGILNGEYVLPEVKEDPFIYNTFAQGIASYKGVTFNKTTEKNRHEIIHIAGDACLYRSATSNGYFIKTQGGIASVEFSETSQWNMDYEYDYLFYGGPFYQLWNGRSLGAGTWGTLWQTNMYAFGTEEEAEEYLSLDDDQKTIYAKNHAENFEDIQNGNYYRPFNPTGSKEDATIFGSPNHKDIFMSRYILTKNQLAQLKDNWIYNESEIANLMNGIEFWGKDSPVDYIVDLSYYPFPIDSVASTEPSALKFGTKTIGLDTAVRRLVTCNGYKDMGTFTFSPTFNNWKDFVTKLYVFLPYIGTMQLDIARYLNKTVNVRYYFDFNTRSCMACLIADGVLLDYKNGQIGIKQSMTSTDFSNYANTQINTLLSVGSGAIQGAMAGGAIGGGAGAAVGAISSAAVGSIGLALNSLQRHDTVTGTSSSVMNEFLPQYVYFIFEIPDIVEPDNHQSVNGRPSASGGSIGSFSGFLQCDEVVLNIPEATDSERNEIINLLKTGIYL